MSFDIGIHETQKIAERVFESEPLGSWRKGPLDAMLQLPQSYLHLAQAAVADMATHLAAADQDCQGYLRAYR